MPLGESCSYFAGYTGGGRADSPGGHGTPTSPDSGRSSCPNVEGNRAAELPRTPPTLTGVEILKAVPCSIYTSDVSHAKASST